MERWLILVPAYGRNYKSREAVLGDWLQDKDFLVQDISCQWNGFYISRSGAESSEELQGCVFEIRYKCLEKTVLICHNNQGQWVIK